MSQPAPSYPTSVWTGASASRAADPTLDREPDWKDWDRAVEEIQAMQTDLLHGLNAKNVALNAPANVRGSIPVVHTFTIPAATGNVDIVVSDKIKVVDVVAYKTTANGGAGDQVIIQNGTDAITNAISLNITDTTIARATTINDAFNTVNAAGTLRAAATNATSCAAVVHVFGLLVA